MNQWTITPRSQRKEKKKKRFFSIIFKYNHPSRKINKSPLNTSNQRITQSRNSIQKQTHSKFSKLYPKLHSFRNLPIKISNSPSNIYIRSKLPRTICQNEGQPPPNYSDNYYVVSRVISGHLANNIEPPPPT